jgi:serine/threonine protein kinase
VLEPGSVFANRFEIEGRAGAGGMGAVYRARDRYTSERVALKLLHPEGSGAQASERFDREARLLSELRHPGIVSYVAHGEAPDGRRFLAMEWLDGEDLAARLLRGPLSLDDSLLLLRRVAEALGVAHARGVVHRDLKPGNVFLVGGDVARPKLLDFGIARRLVSSRAMTRAGALVGTPDYMAPEQARGQGDITPSADVFSLGCVLYECLAGQPPFAAEHMAAVLARILFEDPPPLDERRPDVPAAVSSLVERMLAKYPAQRLAGAGALLVELDALGALPEVVSAPTITLPRRDPRRCSRRGSRGCSAWSSPRRRSPWTPTRR